ncbi:MAG: endonuclease/exonuclease/phosphatase family protein [Acidobacteria bacterium]|nr:endonuclease/exonuclease/phosphatase family protein [Acidobacteriota bacterium]
MLAADESHRTPIVVPGSRSVEPPPFTDLVVVTWNVQLGRGRLPAFVRDLRRGRLTDGVPALRFAILLQEAMRRSDEVPVFTDGWRSAKPIRGADSTVGDIASDATALSLSLVYAPAMRNGPENREDRGNAIISTEPIRDIEIVELPFSRQRRIALGLTLDIAIAGVRAPLRLMNVHLDARGTRLGLFGSPRQQQMQTLLDWLQRPASLSSMARAGTVLGGDLNTVHGGSDEVTYRAARRWSASLGSQDVRDTHSGMGRLDYLFFRLLPGWTASTTRSSSRYGSDHHPVVGRFMPPTTP